MSVDDKPCPTCDSKRSFDDWMSQGITMGWAGPPVCATHDGIPMTDEEEAQCEEGEDPCIHVIRPYHDADEKKAVEDNHFPSKWRDTYSNAQTYPSGYPELGG